jgi:exosortase F-associated protein
VNSPTFYRIVIGATAAIGLVIVFVFQQTNLAALGGLAATPSNQFIINKLIRFFLNDALTILLIFSLFGKKKYVMFAVWVQLTGMVLFLIPYLVVKIWLPDYNGPLINFIHRLILNPTLLLLLIPAFILQDRSKGSTA